MHSAQVNVIIVSFVDLQFGQDSVRLEISLQSEHLIRLLSTRCVFLRSFASISNIKSALSQSFSDIGKFGNL